MKRHLLVFGLATTLALTSLGVLTGCQSDVHGKTLYSVSSWDGGGYSVGDVSTITFGADDDSFHYVSEKSEITGTWSDEEGDIVLTSTLWGVETLERLDDGSGYEVLGGEEAFGTRFYPTEEAAEAYSNEYVSDAPQRVRGVLESTEFVPVSDNRRTKDETISFMDGTAAFTRGEYEQEGYLFLAGPSDGDWTASDHSGEYDLTVDDMTRSSVPASAQYVGTLTLDGESVDYRLWVRESGQIELDIEGLTFKGGK